MIKIYIGENNKLKFQGKILKRNDRIECTETEWKNLFENQCFFKNDGVSEVSVENFKPGHTKKRGKK